MEFDIENEKVELNKDGITYDCDILVTFDSEDTNKSYIAYTDHSVDDKGNLNIYVSSYNPLIESKTLEEITDPRELEMVNDVINSIKNNEL